MRTRLTRLDPTDSSLVDRDYACLDAEPDMRPQLEQNTSMRSNDLIVEVGGVRRSNADHERVRDDLRSVGRSTGLPLVVPNVEDGVLQLRAGDAALCVPARLPLTAICAKGAFGGAVHVPRGEEGLGLRVHRRLL